MGVANGSGSREVPGAITTVHRYELPLGKESVWSLMSGVERYRSWWPWLRQFEAGGLSVGDEWRCTVQPPVPYLVRFRVVIEHVEAPGLVQAQVLGDVVGDATLTLEPADKNGAEAMGCVALLHSSLAPGNRALAIVSRFAAPVARFGHDWVLDSAARQFIARAIEPALGDAAS
ncbi:MAG TPA: hypothetical protein VK773_02075 [Acidimicrobiales bacterium]|nr:hypothetical protein [Acidimicrobiales bacterium]